MVLFILLLQKIVWNTNDSALLHESLEVREEPTPGVGLGLYLKRNLSSCCCAQARTVREAEQRLLPELLLLHEQEKMRRLKQQGRQEQLQGQHKSLLGLEGSDASRGAAKRRRPLAAATAPPPAGAEEIQQSSGLTQESEESPAAAEWKTHSSGDWQQRPEQLLLPPTHHGTGAAEEAATAPEPEAEAAAETGSLSVAPDSSETSACPATEALQSGHAVGKKGARMCSCNPSSCFRVLCFRGDPVLSPFNFMASAGEGALSAEEKKVLMAPEENPGKK